MSAIPLGPAAGGVVVVPPRPFTLFVATEARSAIPLLGATTAALVWANSPWAAGYEALWPTSLSVQVGEADGRLLGGITTSRLIRQLLGAP